MAEQEYTKAFSDMGVEPLDIDERQRFEEIRQRYDTPQKQSARKAAERQRLKRAAQLAGFNSIVQLANAILANEIEVVRKEKE
jgi:hypothetical protein